MDPKFYTLTLSETQLKVCLWALDLFSRIGIGQFEEIAQVYDSGRRDGEVLPDPQSYNAIATAREYLDHAKMALTGYHRNASHGIHSPYVQDKYRVAFDVMQVVRNLMHKESGSTDYSVAASVHQTSTLEPLAKIERVPA